MKDFLIIALLLAGIIGMYLLSYKMNKKTPPPVDAPVANCSACASNGHCAIQAASLKKDKDELPEFTIHKH